jgi:AraC-like DNA-binding protein
MPRSTLSVFSEPDDFQAALEEGGRVNLIVTGLGKFRARLSRITLHRMRLAGGEERQTRVAFNSLGSRFVRITLPTGPPGSLVCSGIATQSNEVVVHGPGHRFHVRTNGPCRWGAMWILANDLVASGHAMNGAKFALPSGECRWQPSPDALRSLTGLHRDAIRATEAHPSLPVDDQAARGLEQQLLAALMECLSGKPLDRGDPTRRRHAEIMLRFEDVLGSSLSKTSSMASIRAALGVSESTLRTCCHAFLGIGPSRYVYLRRMQLANRALRDADNTEESVDQIAKLYGFNARGGFPKAYRMLFGELPGMTLRRRTVQ